MTAAAILPHRGYLARSLDEVRIARLPVTVVESTYEARVFRGDRLIGFTVYTGLGDQPWHIPTAPQTLGGPVVRWRHREARITHHPKRVAWASYGTRAQAVDVLRRMAAGQS